MGPGSWYFFLSLQPLYKSMQRAKYKDSHTESQRPVVHAPPPLYTHTHRSPTGTKNMFLSIYQTLKAAAPKLQMGTATLF